MRTGGHTDSSLRYLAAPVVAKRGLLILGLLSIPFGVAVVAVSQTLLNGTYYGSWYAGMLTLILGILSMGNGFKSNLILLNLRWILPVTGVCIILCITGIALSWSLYNVVQPLAACAYQLSGYQSSSSCFPGSNTTVSTACVGSVESYHNAFECQLEQAVPIGGSTVSCSCVPGGSSSCHLISNVPSCHYALDLYPAYLRINFSLCFVCLFLALCICCVSVVYGYDVFQLSTSSAVQGGSEEMRQYYFDPERGINLEFSERDKPVPAAAQFGPKTTAVLLRDEGSPVATEVQTLPIINASILSSTGMDDTR